MKKLDKSHIVNGKNIRLRAATPDDAPFVYQMRINEKKNKHLNKIEGGIEDQKQWLAKCHADPFQIYFVITSLTDQPLGLVRLYDQKDDSFCLGSWLIKEDAPASTAIESALMVYSYALDVIGFTKSHFDVRIGNDKVINFHKNFGAVEISRNQQDIFFEISYESIRQSILKYKKYLPNSIQTEITL